MQIVEAILSAGRMPDGSTGRAAKSGAEAEFAVIFDATFVDGSAEPEAEVLDLAAVAPAPSAPESDIRLIESRLLTVEASVKPTLDLSGDRRAADPSVELEFDEPSEVMPAPRDASAVLAAPAMPAGAEAAIPSLPAPAVKKTPNLATSPEPADMAPIIRPSDGAVPAAPAEHRTAEVPVSERALAVSRRTTPIPAEPAPRLEAVPAPALSGVRDTPSPVVSRAGIGAGPAAATPSGPAPRPVDAMMVPAQAIAQPPVPRADTADPQRASTEARAPGVLPEPAAARALAVPLAMRSRPAMDAAPVTVEAPPPAPAPVALPVLAPAANALPVSAPAGDVPMANPVGPQPAAPTLDVAETPPADVETRPPAAPAARPEGWAPRPDLAPHPEPILRTSTGASLPQSLPAVPAAMRMAAPTIPPAAFRIAPPAVSPGPERVLVAADPAASTTAADAGPAAEGAEPVRHEPSAPAVATPTRPVEMAAAILQGLDAVPLGDAPESSVSRTADPPSISGSGHAAAAPDPDVRRAVFEQLLATVRSTSSGTVEIMLSPEELGHVRLEMKMVDGVMTVRIDTDRPETLDLMRRGADVLFRELRDAGFGALNLSFGSGTPQRGSFSASGGAPGRHDGDATIDMQAATAPASPPRGLGSTRLDIRI